MVAMNFHWTFTVQNYIQYKQKIEMEPCKIVFIADRKRKPSISRLDRENCRREVILQFSIFEEKDDMLTDNLNEQRFQDRLC